MIRNLLNRLLGRPTWIEDAVERGFNAYALELQPRRRAEQEEETPRIVRDRIPSLA